MQPNPVPIYHRHFSSLRLRMFSGVEESNSRYLCPSCKSHHWPYPYERVKIVVTDSTLHQFFAPPGAATGISNQYQGDLIHVDYISIPGATIEDLIRAFKADYEQLPQIKPLDVVLVAGYNDLVKGYSRELITHTFRKFTRAVLQQGSTNTVGISTLMYPPQLAWYPDNGPEPPNYHNQMEKIHWINTEIKSLNVFNGAEHCPGFHTYGVRRVTRTWTDVFGQVTQRQIKQHRWEHWRETSPTRMLHLTNERRYKMGAAINNYFVLRTT